MTQTHQIINRFPPTVVLTSDPSDQLVREEIFGPLVAVVPFDDEADAAANWSRRAA